MTHYDAWETRDAATRAASLAECLPAQIASAQGLEGHADRLTGIDASQITDRAALAGLPVLRKADLVALQQAKPPFGGLTVPGAEGFAHLFQSPGPIYEPGQVSHDWWRLGRFLHAAGIGSGDVVLNCFAYHLTPAGHIFENGARAVGAAVIPAGTGQTELQVQAAAHLGATAYAGTPDFLKAILEKADELGVTLAISKAAVSGGALFTSLREFYAGRRIACLQCYATADLGNIAYESPACEGLIVEEGVIVEIVTPGTGDPVPEGEVGEVVVTSLNPDYPLIRFATGDLSAVLPGQSPCGRTNMRIRGWMGRADQTAKVKGMFVRPEQVAQLVTRHPEIDRVRLVIDRAGEADALTVQIEAPRERSGQTPEAGSDRSPVTAPARYADSAASIFRLRGEIVLVAPGSLPRDGIVIEDRRDTPAS